ncbi:MAG: DUF1801 domain-containing protein [Candidatus Thorarchaeota archaeon]
MTTIDIYIEQQSSPQKEILQKLREIILDTFPDSTEEMKWGVPNFNNGLFYIVALKDHVNLGFSSKGLSADELALFEGTGKTMRHLKIRTVQDINEERIVDLLKLVAEKT